MRNPDDGRNHLGGDMGLLPKALSRDSQGSQNVRMGGISEVIEAVAAEFSALELIGGTKGLWLLDFTMATEIPVNFTYSPTTLLDGDSDPAAIRSFDPARPLISTAREGSLNANTIFQDDAWQWTADVTWYPLHIASGQILIIGNRVVNEAFTPNILLAELD